MAQSGSIVVVGDEEFDIVIERGEKGIVIFRDPVLAKLGEDLNELRSMERKVRGMIRGLEAKQEKRLLAVGGIGSLHDYPTHAQRELLRTYEMAAKLGNIPIMTATYNLAIQMECHRTSWRDDDGHPLPVSFEMTLARLERAQEQDAG